MATFLSCSCFGRAVDALFNLAFGEESGVNARGIGGFPLKSEFANETEKERGRRARFEHSMEREPCIMS